MRQPQEAPPPRIACRARAGRYAQRTFPVPTRLRRGKPGSSLNAASRHTAGGPLTRGLPFRAFRAVWFANGMLALRPQSADGLLIHAARLGRGLDAERRRQKLTTVPVGIQSLGTPVLGGQRLDQTTVKHLRQRIQFDATPTQIDRRI